MTFGKWLVGKRKEAHLTQAQLAERCGISAVYVSALERGEPNARDGSPRRLRQDKVERLAKALGVDVNEALLAAGYAPTRPHAINGFTINLPWGAESVLFYSDDVQSEEDARDFEAAVWAAWAVTKQHLARKREKG